MAAILVFFCFQGNWPLWPRFQTQNSKEHLTLNEAIRANLHGNKRILKRRTFWNKVYFTPYIKRMTLLQVKGSLDLNWQDGSRNYCNIKPSCVDFRTKISIIWIYWQISNKSPIVSLFKFSSGVKILFCFVMLGEWRCRKCDIRCKYAQNDFSKVVLW